MKGRIIFTMIEETRLARKNSKPASSLFSLLFSYLRLRYEKVFHTYLFLFPNRFLGFSTRSVASSPVVTHVWESNIMIAGSDLNLPGISGLFWSKQCSISDVSHLSSCSLAFQGFQRLTNAGTSTRAASINVRRIPFVSIFLAVFSETAHHRGHAHCL